MSNSSEQGSPRTDTPTAAGSRDPSAPAPTPCPPLAPHVGWVYGALLGDHARIDGLLARLADASQAGETAAIDPVWTELERLLLRHMETEETHLLPLLEPSVPDGVAGILAEHTAIRTWMAQLGVDIELHACLASVVQDFAQLLRDHADGEEKLLYRVADAEVERPERRHLCDDLREIFANGPRPQWT